MRLWCTVMSSVALLSSAFALGLRPEPDITVSGWADQFRMVGKPSPAPGPWRTWRVPYTREIMDRLSPSDPCEIVALMKGAQGAGTEIALNALGCWMHLYPDSAMMACPTIGASKRFSHIRFDRMVEATPVLRGLVAPPRSREASNTAQLKEFGPGRDTLVFVGANSGVDLRSYPSRFVICDEVDGYPLDLDKEGNPLDLIIQRTGAMPNRKIYLCSTPTLLNASNIHRWFQAGDQNYFHVPCPHCTRVQALIFGADRVKTGQPGGLRWPKGSPDLVRYQCEHCGDDFAEWEKVELLQRGVWLPAAPGNGGGKIRSYHMNALIYPYGWPENSWTNLAASWERVHGNPVARKTFWNLKLGLPWSDPSEAKADAKTLQSRCHAYGPEVPAEVGVLIASADVQGNRIEAELVGWGPDEESWQLEYKVLLGDTGEVTNPVWKELDDWLKMEWLSELGIPLTIKASCIDSSYGQDVVRQFCHERKSRNVWAIKGKEGYGRLVWPLKLGRQKGKLPPPFIVGVDTAKEIVYSRLKIDTPGPGYCHFRTGTPIDYFEMLTSEIRVADYSRAVPVYAWKKKSDGDRNEALDDRVYNYAGLKGLETMTAFKLNRECQKLRDMAEALRTGTKRTFSMFTPSAPMVADDPYLS
jgi:phage terminase large subunit GpA-like protein